MQYWKTLWWMHRRVSMSLTVMLVVIRNTFVQYLDGLSCGFHPSKFWCPHSEGFNVSFFSPLNCEDFVWCPCFEELDGQLVGAFGMEYCVIEIHHEVCKHTFGDGLAIFSDIHHCFERVGNPTCSFWTEVDAFLCARWRHCYHCSDGQQHEN